MTLCTPPRTHKSRPSVWHEKMMSQWCLRLCSDYDERDRFQAESIPVSKFGGVFRLCQNERRGVQTTENATQKFETLYNRGWIAEERCKMKSVLWKGVQTTNHRTQPKTPENWARSRFAFVGGRNDSMITWERTHLDSVVWIVLLQYRRASPGNKNAKICSKNAEFSVRLSQKRPFPLRSHMTVHTMKNGVRSTAFDDFALRSP